MVVIQIPEFTSKRTTEMAMLQKKIQLASRALSLTKIILKIKMEHFEGEKKKLGKKILSITILQEAGIFQDRCSFYKK